MSAMMTKQDFNRLELEDKEWVQNVLREDKSIGCEYTFASMYLWQEIYDLTFARMNHCLIRKSGEDKTSIYYHYPIGIAKNRIKAVRRLMKEAGSKKKELHLYGLSELTLSELNGICKDIEWEYKAVRDNQNYILRTEQIAELSGKVYRDKRRFTNRFMENNNWSYDRLTKQKVEACTAMNEEWCRAQMASQEKTCEVAVTNKAFQLYEELDLSGGVLEVDGKVIAFMLGEELSEEMYVVHFLKAYRNVYGAYQMMVHRMAKDLAGQYIYMNLEEDMGIEGLRQAKKSWAPEFLSTYYDAVIPFRIISEL